MKSRSISRVNYISPAYINSFSFSVPQSAHSLSLSFNTQRRNILKSRNCLVDSQRTYKGRILERSSFLLPSSTLFQFSRTRNNTLRYVSKQFYFSDKMQNTSSISTLNGSIRPNNVFKNMETKYTTANEVSSQSSTKIAVQMGNSSEDGLNWVPHRVDSKVPIKGPGNDWVSPLYNYLRLARDFRPPEATHTHRPRILVLYGTLRPKGFSKLLAYECGRIADLLDLDVRIFNPDGLPVRDPELSEHHKVLELRNLVEWSEGHIWVASELHGGLCSVFKNQIDWIPLNTGSIRPTQGKCAVVLQVCGGSQSFNVVNALRLLARWMRMSCVVNQSAVPMAWKQFDDEGRMKEGSLRERVVDVIEEFSKTVRINREYANFLTDRYSERKEREEKGRLLTQAEKEAEKNKP